MALRAFGLFLALGVTACGGGGGGGAPPPAFGLAASVPAPGQTDADPDSSIILSFSGPVALPSFDATTVSLTRADGQPVGLHIMQVGANPSSVTVDPVQVLDPNERYRLLVRGAVRSSGGNALGADVEICFITASPGPTVRPDQVLDLGDRLNVPRYLAQSVRLQDGRTVVIGGFASATEATDTLEVWDAAARRFELMPTRLLAPRAEFTATLLPDGRVFVAGGVSAPGGPPLATTEFVLPGGTSSAGPPLLEARRWHAASRFGGGGSVLVSGGFGATGDRLDTVEVLDGSAWRMHTGTLPEPTAQHLQFLSGLDDIYATVGSFRPVAALIDSVGVRPRHEGDVRFRSAALQTLDGRVLVVGGDTRSIVIHDFASEISWLANDLLFDRRGAHTLTPRGGNLYLAAGGFQITAGGRAIDSLEVVEYLPSRLDARVHTVWNVKLPVPFAGHVGFLDPDGATVLAGGFVDGGGDHSRRVVLVFDGSAPPFTCR